VAYTICNNPANKKAILAISGQHCSDDKFTRDPLISNELAKKRLDLYITKSLSSYPRQFVYGLFNSQTEELIGFRTGIFAEPGLVKYFYYFMQKEEERRHELTKARGHEGTNSLLPTFHFSLFTLHFFKFVVDRTMVLMRKIF
jgi:hypothetical protein